jgi:molybdopterin-binding protein
MDVDASDVKTEPAKISRCTRLRFDSTSVRGISGSYLIYTYCRRIYAVFLLKLSARNKLDGTIEEIKMADVVAHVTVQVSGGSIDSVITRRSAQEMNLKVGDKFRAVIKSTEVMLKKD